MKRVMVLTGGGDCPGLNAVIRGVVKRASIEKDWEVLGCIESFNGLLKDPMELELLTEQNIRGILGRGGTILQTTNVGGPFAWPVKNPDGTWKTIDRSDEMIQKIKDLGIDAVINIGGDGSQRISAALYEKGLNIVGVPKTIDNDLSYTDYSFGFQTAVQIATDALDRLATTAMSHNRTFILEVMGRDTGWIALNTAIAGGAAICLIPEIPYDINKIIEKINSRYRYVHGFCNIVIAEGAYPKDGTVVGESPTEVGNHHVRLGGVSAKLTEDLKKMGVDHEIRFSILGHLQRGGTPSANDRILASSFGVKAFEMVLNKEFGKMAAYQKMELVSVPLKDVVGSQKFIDPNHELVRTAKKLGISFGD